MSRFHFPSLKTSLLTIGILMIPVFGYLIWTLTTTPATLSESTEDYGEAGKQVREDFQLLPTLAFTETDDTYTVEDTATEGIQITFATAETKPEEKPKLNLSFPKDYTEPIEVKLDDKRSIQITDLSGKDGYTSESLQAETLTQEDQGFFANLFDTKAKDAPKQYLRYASDDGRKSLLYAFQKDQATGEKKLKHWTIYQEGTGLETEEYQINNAKVRINEGKAEVFYFGEKAIQNEAVKAEVDQNLLERAQRTLAKEMGEDIMTGGQTPDFIIPEPYYLDRKGEQHEAKWQWNDESKTLSVTLTPSVEQYPIALDPTLSFTAPGVSNGGSVIDGETASQFATAFATGDFNTDGKTDLAVGAPYYSGIAQGRVYLFYGDGSLIPNAGNADVMITGVANTDLFGLSLEAGDFNADGRTDLVVGSYHSTAYIFYNDGSYPSSASSADVTITGANEFSNDMATGDFNSDGRIDLAIGEYAYSSFTGRAYIFYNDGSIPTTSATADVTINGNAADDVFGRSLIAGDFNSDGRTDLVVGGSGYSSNTGRIYIFYNDGSIPTTAATADLTMTGDVAGRRFGQSLAAGDFNTDGRVDLAAGSPNGGGGAGYTFIFYNDGSIPTSPASADVTIANSTTHGYFGSQITAGDMNADGRTDLISSASDYTLYPGAAFVFYNDGSIPTDTIRADVTIEGQNGSMLGGALAIGDLNSDGRADLIVGGITYGAYTGRAYVFYSQDGQVNTNQNITGNASSDNFGNTLTTGDLNSDGRTDLVVGATGYSTSTGRAYIFYGDGQIPSTAGTADVTITGNATSDTFGGALTTGDFNADGKTDLAVAAPGYSSSTGRTYIFHNDGSIPTTAATADVTITGDGTYLYFGNSLVSGDLNADGRIDLVASGFDDLLGNSRTYIFHNDGSIPTTAGTADVTITGAANGQFSNVAGDFNADGRTDLAVGSGFDNYAYLFYNDGSIPTTTGTADVAIAGEASSSFGTALASGDWNADGRTDLAVGAGGYSTNTGRTYIFYNDGSIPTTAGTADVTITGNATSDTFGGALTTGDFNADGKTDLAVAAPGYSSSTGRTYIFHNDGSIPTTAATADVIITGEATSNYFGLSLATGELNGDGRADLIVGAYGNSTNTGKVYFYETRENFSWEIQKQFKTTAGTRIGLNGTGQEMQITGQGAEQFGYALATGDFNADGRTDLAVSANIQSIPRSNAGRVYIFYSDGSLAIGAASADVVIVGSGSSNRLGEALVAGDFNADGRTDLVAGGYNYSALFSGAAYLFYNDGSWPTTSAEADLRITGEVSNDLFGYDLEAGDFNADGRIDLVVGATQSTTTAGRAYIFYNDGSLPTTAATADVIITGEAASGLGTSFASGDFNADGRIDLAIGAGNYSSGTGRAYLFYNDGSIPTTAATADVTITGETTSNIFGNSMVSGDFNVDGRTDLVVGAFNASSAAGRAYLFYNDGSIPTTAATADVIIAGEAGSAFGVSLVSGDFNVDGRTDLAVGASSYSSNTGRAYIFYNDGSIPTTAATADVTSTGETSSNYFGYSLTAGDFNADGRIDLAVGGYNYLSAAGRTYVYTFGNDSVTTGEATNNYFGIAMTSGDFNADGRTDLAVGASGASSNGRTYLFYSDGQIPAAASSADVIITGEAASNFFGIGLTSGDFNTDGKTDLAVGAEGYSSSAGRAYIFYNDGSIPTTAGTADVIITGGATNNLFGHALAGGDFNFDGRTDLVVGAYGYSTNTGRAYIFYNDGSIPTTAGTADVTITGSTSSTSFALALAAGDFNADGRTDLAVGAYQGGGNGHAYIFYNDGSIPTTAGTADLGITGSAESFGISVAAGDFNTDGKTDLAVGAEAYSTNTGRAYIFYNDGSMPTTSATADVTITGEATNNYFGYSLAVGDLNFDGRTDLVVGATGYSTFTGRAYIFYNDGSIPTTAGTADVTMTGQATSSYFSRSLACGDFNSDGKADVAIGAHQYSTNTGRVYLFTSEAAPTSVSPGTSSLKGTGTLKGTMQWK